MLDTVFFQAVHRSVMEQSFMSLDGDKQIHICACDLQLVTTYNLNTIHVIGYVAYVCACYATALLLLPVRLLLNGALIWYARRDDALLQNSLRYTT